MRVLEEIAESPFLISPLNPNSTASGYKWVDKCHGFVHNTVLVAASLFFVAYLACEAKKSFSKLSNRRSYIMIAYYGCLWLVSLLNLAWCCLQAWECTPEKQVVWNLVTLFTTSGMLFLEVSLVAFLFQGNYASGAEALTRTFLISGFIIALDLLFKAIFLSGFGVPLFVDNNENGQKFKWGLWIIHKLLLTGVYGMIFLMYNSKWRESDEVIEPDKDKPSIPEVRDAPMTRARERKLMEAFNQAVETLLNTKELGDIPTITPESVAFNESSSAPNLDLMEDFARLSIKEASPTKTHCKSICLAGEGDKNIKNLSKVTSELQVTSKTSNGPDKLQMEQKDKLEDEHVQTLEDLLQSDLKGLQEEEFTTDFKPHGPEPYKTLYYANGPDSRQNQVFTLFMICAGKDELS